METMVDEIVAHPRELVGVGFLAALVWVAASMIA